MTGEKVIGLVAPKRGGGRRYTHAEHRKWHGKIAQIIESSSTLVLYL